MKNGIERSWLRKVETIELEAIMCRDQSKNISVLRLSLT